MIHVPPQRWVSTSICLVLNLVMKNSCLFCRENKSRRLSNTVSSFTRRLTDRLTVRLTKYHCSSKLEELSRNISPECPCFAFFHGKLCKNSLFSIFFGTTFIWKHYILSAICVTAGVALDVDSNVAVDEKHHRSLPLAF